MKTMRTAARVAAPLIGSAAVLIGFATARGESPASQVDTGARVYGQTCVSCHGAALGGGAGAALRPIEGLKALPAKTVTATDLARWIKVNMPVSDPGSLTEVQSYAVTAYILNRNGRPPSAQPLSATNGSSVLVRGSKK